MSAHQPKHVTVLMGGWSAERAVSLVSGAAIARALLARGYEVTTVDVRRDLAHLVAALSQPRPDVVFNALHGRGGEDGLIQGVLEYLGLPYTHSGVMASAIAMDKAMTKRVLSTVGMPLAASVVVSRDELLAGIAIEPPYVIKPVDEGSSVGVRIVRPGANRDALADEPWALGDTVLVEKFIPGRELTVGVMGDRALAVTEIKAETEFFDYTAKYTQGHAVHVCPADIPAAVAEEAKRLALLAHATLGCRGVSRSDFRWDEDARASGAASHGLVFLEINTQPGFTPLSLLPEQAAHLGMDYGELCAWIVERATCLG